MRKIFLSLFIPIFLFADSPWSKKEIYKNQDLYLKKGIGSFEEIELQKERYLKKIFAGKPVKHTCKDKVKYVAFSNGERSFIYPDGYEYQMLELSPNMAFGLEIWTKDGLCETVSGINWSKL